MANFINPLLHTHTGWWESTASSVRIPLSHLTLSIILIFLAAINLLYNLPEMWRVFFASFGLMRVKSCKPVSYRLALITSLV
jgi:hypothetical protein